MTAASGPSRPSVDIRAALRDTARTARSIWSRSVGVALALTAAFVGVLLLAVCLLSELAIRQSDALFRDGEIVTTGVVRLVFQVGVPTLVAGAFLTVMTLAAGVTLADDELAGKRSTVASSLSRALRRGISTLLALVLAGIGVLFALAATPLLMVAGALGLLLTPAVRLVARRSGRTGWWPSTRSLAVLLVPALPAAVLAGRWSLVLPAAVLERRDARSALERSSALMAGRAVRAAGVLAAAFVVYLASLFALEGVGDRIDQDQLFWFIRWLLQVGLMTVPLALTVVLFRQLAGPTDPDLVVPSPTPRMPTRIFATSILLAVAVVAGSVSLRATEVAAEDLPVEAVEDTSTADPESESEPDDGPADADPTSDDGEPGDLGVTFYVDDLGDEGDAAPGDAACATEAGGCTLRAAVEEITASPVEDLTVVMSIEGTISVSSPIDVATSFTMDGSGMRVVLSGGGSAGILHFTEPTTSFSLSNLTFAGSGAAAIETVAHGSLESVTFTGNASESAGGAIAVLGGGIGVNNATFAGNSAPVGADIAVSAGASASVTQSTFIDGSSSAVFNGGGDLTIYSSILTSSGETVCDGPMHGGLNLAREGQCNGREEPTGLAGLGDNGGSVHTVALMPESNAIDAGNPEGCSPTDARGMQRPQGERCDVGAFESEYSAPTGAKLAVDDLGDEPDADPGDGVCDTGDGVCTLRAAAEEVHALDGPPARIDFAVSGTVTVAEPVVLDRQVVLSGNGNRVILTGAGATRIIEAPEAVDVTIERLTLAAGRTDDASGGGAMASAANLTTDSVTIRDSVSTASAGGAVAVSGGVAVFRNTTFWQNEGVGGSDLWISEADYSAFENSTLVGGSDGSVLNDGLNDFYLFNSLVIPAAGPACTGRHDGAATFTSDESCRGGRRIEPADLALGTLGNHGGPVPTVNLLPGSHAIDAVGWGTQSYCPATDARGVARPYGQCDSGAYEYVDGSVLEPATVRLSADPAAPTMGQEIRLTATVSSPDPDWAPNGSVTFSTSTEVLGSAAVDPDGNAGLAVPSLPVGDHTVTATFDETDDLGAASDAIVVTVGRAATTTTLSSSVNPSIVRGAVTLTARVDVVSPGSGPATGTVEFWQGDALLGSAALNSGTATLSTSTLPVGSHPITAVYQGDDERAESTSAALHQVVNAAGAAVALSAPPSSVHGQTVSITATVTPFVTGHVATGSVAFTIDGMVLGSAQITDGVATLSTPLGTVGRHELLATYAGTSEISPAVSDPLPHEVTKASTTTTLTSSASSSNHGDRVTVTASVQPVAPGGGIPAGTVVLLRDGAEVDSGTLDASGSFSSTVDDLPGGTHSFIAVYAGSSEHEPSGSEELSHEVRRWTTETSLSFSPNPVFGEGLDFEVTVTSPAGAPTPAGIVSVTVGSSSHYFELDADGRATGTADAPAAGTVTVKARFWISDSHDGSVTEPFDIVVAKAPTAIGLDAPATSAKGQPVQLTALVTTIGQSARPTGTVTFRSGTTVLGTATVDGTGVAQLHVDGLAVGDHLLTGSFTGEDHANSSSDVMTHRVVPARTKLTLEHTPERTVVGQPVTLVAEVVSIDGPSVPAGTVVWTVDGTELGRGPLGADGTASITTSEITVGSRTVTASFVSDGDHTDSSDSVGHVVAKATTSIALTMDPLSVVTGQPVTYTARVSVEAPGATEATGTVTFSPVSDEPVPVGPDGVARITVPAPAVGTGLNLVTATYWGGVTTERSEHTLSHRVNLAPASVSVSANPNPVTMGEPLSVRVTVGAVAPGTIAPAGGTIVLLRSGTAIATVSAAGTETTVDVSTPDVLPVGTSALTAELRDAYGFAVSRSAPLSVVVLPRTPTLTLTSGLDPSVLGQSVTFEAVLSGGPLNVRPTGSIRLFDGDREVGGSSVEWLGSAWGTRVTTSDLAVGSRSLLAIYQSTTNAYRDARSEPLIQIVQPIPTATSFTMPTTLTPGATTTWTVYVSNEGPRVASPAAPTGSVAFSVDGAAHATVALRPGPITGWSTASVTSPPLEAGVHQVVATYVPTESFGASEAILDQPVGKLDPWLELTSFQSSAPWGSPVLFNARVVVPGHSTTLPVPTGLITISSAGGGTCQVSAAGGACVLQWADPGIHTVTASYAGNRTYSAITSTPTRVVITKRTPTITGSVSTNTPDTGTPVTMTWEVSGPATGSVSAHLGGTTCATTLVGTCTATPSLEEARSLYPAGVNFAGDSHWNGIQWSGTVRPVACIPVRLTVEFGEGGDLTTSTPPNCGGGTGYRQGTWLEVEATPAVSEDPSFDWYLHSLQPGGGSFPRQGFVVGQGGTGTDFVVAQFRRRVKCAQVTLGSEVLPGATGALVGLTEPNCPAEARGGRPAGWQTSSRVRTAMFQLGTTVRTDIFYADSETEVYGFRRGWGAPVSQQRQDSFVVEGETHVTAVLGPRCYEVDAAAVGGTATITTAENCNDPRGTSGWRQQSTVVVVAQPDADRQTLDRWDGGGSESALQLCAGCGEKGVDRVQYLTTLRIEPNQGTRRVRAHFVACYTLDVEVQHGFSQGGEVSVLRPGDCPGRSNSNWYRSGTEVTLMAKETGRARFAKWNMAGLLDRIPWTGLTMDRDIVVRPSFTQGNECVSVELRSADPSWVQVSTEGSVEDLFCEVGGLTSEPADQMSGRRVIETPFTMTATAAQGDPLLGWQIETHKRIGRSPGDQLTVVPNQWMTATATACVGLDAKVALTDPTGRTTVQHMAQGDFLSVWPASNCPYMEGAWLVGTKVYVAASADTLGYEFQGWTGAEASGLPPELIGEDEDEAETAASTEEDEDDTFDMEVASVVLDGSRPIVDVQVAYRMKCHQLTLTHDFKEVQVHPEPNCPGSDGSEGRYIGGTLVLLQGRVPGGKVWVGWTGDVVQRGKVNPAQVHMDDDKSAGHRWRSPDLDEKIVDGLEWFGNQLAVGLKKAVGVTALVAMEVLTSQPPLNILTQVGIAAMALEMALSVMGVPSEITDVLGYIHQTIALTTAGLTCLATWAFSSGSNDTGKGAAHLGSKVGGNMTRDALFAAEEAEEYADALADLESQRTFIHPDSRGFKALTTLEETTSLKVKAKLQFTKLKPARAAAARGVGLAMGVYGAYQNGEGIAWDSSAEDAWTDWGAYERCMKAAVPDYMIPSSGGGGGGRSPDDLEDEWDLARTVGATTGGPEGEG